MFRWYWRTVGTVPSRWDTSCSQPRCARARENLNICLKYSKDYGGGLKKIGSRVDLLCSAARQEISIGRFPASG
jgi:hypothetical protein